MTPKEKAKVLVDRFWNDVTYQNEEYKPNAEAKKCALICVDEILELQLELSHDDNVTIIADFYKEVKKEINKI